MATWCPWLWWFYGCWHHSNGSVWASFTSSCRGSLCEFAEAPELSSLLSPNCQGLPCRSHKLTFLKDPRRRRRGGTGRHSFARTPRVSGQPRWPWAWTWPRAEVVGGGRGLPEMSSSWVCHRERPCCLVVQRLPISQDKLEIQIFTRFTILRFLYVGWNFFSELWLGWGRQTKQVCVPDVVLGALVCNFCWNILSGITWCTWRGFMDLIYGPVTPNLYFQQFSSKYN